MRRTAAVRAAASAWAASAGGSRGFFEGAALPEKRNTVPERHILVLGDSMADWLAYGLRTSMPTSLRWV